MPKPTTFPRQPDAMPSLAPPLSQKAQWALCIVAGIITLGWITFGPQGIWQYLQLRGAVKAMAIENLELKQANSEMLTEIARLQNDERYLEEIARHKFGLLKPNEIVFDFSRKTKKKH